MSRSFFTYATSISLTLATLTAPVFGQTRTREGVAVGGVAGAIAGGIIGHQNDETPEGALIGGAIGALAGGLVGRSQDDAIARENYYRQQAYQQRQQQMRSAVSLSEVVEMARSGLSDSLIVNHVNSRGVLRRLETTDIISLHRQGVSENVIDAIQRAPIAGTVAPRTTVVREVVTPPRPVVVHREYHVVPRYAPRTGIHIHAGRGWGPPRRGGHFHYHRGW